MDVKPTLVILQSWKVANDAHEQKLRLRAEELIDTFMKSARAPKRRAAFRIFFDGSELAVVGKRTVMVKCGMV